MRLRRFRISIRAVMVAVALIAVLISVGIALHERDFGPGYPVVYFVGDLMDPLAPPRTELPRLASSMRAATTRDLWWFHKSRTITPFFLNNSLIVRQSSDGHRQIVSWLQQQRAKRRPPSTRLNPTASVGFR